MFGSSATFDDGGAGRVSMAYESRESSRTVARESTRILVVIVTALFTWLTLLSGLARQFGLYALVVYALLVYALLAALGACAGTEQRCELDDDDGADDRPARHSHTLGYSSVLAWSVGVWLVWLVAAHLFIEADLLFAHGGGSWLLTVALFVCSAATLVVELRPQLATPVRGGAAAHAFAVVFLVCLAFPSERWAPQPSSARCADRAWLVSWVLCIAATPVRVFLFLLASSLLDILAPQPGVPTALPPFGGSAEAPAVGKRAVCAAFASATELVHSEARRTRRIIAQSAWLLVTAGVELAVFGLALLALRFALDGTAFAWYDARTRQTPAPAPIVAPPVHLPAVASGGGGGGGWQPLHAATGDGNRPPAQPVGVRPHYTQAAFVNAPAPVPMAPPVVSQLATSARHTPQTPPPSPPPTGRMTAAAAGGTAFTWE